MNIFQNAGESYQKYEESKKQQISVCTWAWRIICLYMRNDNEI